jgi:FMN phosphatase YigB (HAD superfamily)
MELVSIDYRSIVPWDQVVDEIFNVWLKERHAAAKHYLFEDALATVQALREKHYPQACMAAITNGRGNPLHMKDSTLANYFDFCVSGEDDNVFPNRKPHVGIYEVALQRYQELYPHHHDDTAVAENNEKKPQRYIWIHIGDCLANDVSASADAGAYAVWYNPDIHDNSQQQQPSWSTASKRDIEQRTNLADQGRERVAIRIASLSELLAAIEELLANAKKKYMIFERLLVKMVSRIYKILFLL